MLILNIFIILFIISLHHLKKIIMWENNLIYNQIFYNKIICYTSSDVNFKYF